jgi:HK97 family phage portal protein
VTLPLASVKRGPSPLRPRRGSYTRANNTAAGDGIRWNGPPGGWIIEQGGPAWWIGYDGGAVGPHMPSSHGYAGRAAITHASRILVSGIISHARWEVRRGDELLPTPRWLTDPTLQRPDGRSADPLLPFTHRMSWAYFWGEYMRSALLWGMGYLAVELDEAGTPIPGRMLLINPAYVGTDTHTDVYGIEHPVRVVNDVPATLDGDLELDGLRLRLLELRNPSTPVDPITGTTMGAITAHATELGMIDALNEYGAGTFTSGVPSGYLKSDRPSTREQAREAVGEWEEANGGPRRRTAFLGNTVSYEPIAIKPIDAQLADMKKLTYLDVALAFGVPPDMLGADAGGSNTYANISQRLAALANFTLAEWRSAVTSTLSALLPNGTDLAMTFAPIGVEGATDEPA